MMDRTTGVLDEDIALILHGCRRDLLQDEIQKVFRYPASARAAKDL